MTRMFILMKIEYIYSATTMKLTNPCAKNIPIFVFFLNWMLGVLMLEQPINFVFRLDQLWLDFHDLCNHVECEKKQLINNDK